LNQQYIPVGVCDQLLH